MSVTSWHLLTGEYAPAPGGVAGYTQLIARGLAAAGEEVHVWAPPFEGALASDRNVRLHPLAGGYGGRGLARLAWEFGRPSKARRRLFVQYVPQAFGLKAMNLPFAAWLGRLRRDNELWLMFHEVAVSRAGMFSWKRNAVAAVNERMVREVVLRADRVFAAGEIVESFLRRFVPEWTGKVTSLSVPSTLPTSCSAEDVMAVRDRLGLSANETLIGHFGTFGPLVTSLLTPIVPSLLGKDPRRHIVFIGRDSETFARHLRMSADVGRRVSATGVVSPAEAASFLAACDLVVQPYGDGISGRRTTTMAPLALGVAIVTNAGSSTEDIWRSSGAVAIADSVERIGDLADGILRDPARLSALREKGRRLYAERFSIEVTLAKLRSAGGGEA